MKRPAVSSQKSARSAAIPPSSSATRSLLATATTLLRPLVASLSESPTVGARSTEAPRPSSGRSQSGQLGSSIACRNLPASTHRLATTPCTSAQAPVESVAWSAAVSVTAVS